MDLKEKAKKLGIEFKEDISDEDLQKLIDEKSEELENDIDHLRNEVKKWKSEAESAFSKRDTFKADKTVLSKKIKTLEDKMKKMVGSEEFDSFKDKLKELEAFKSEIDEKAEKKKLEQMDEVKRAEVLFNKEKKTWETQMGELQEKFSKMETDNSTKLVEAQDQIRTLRKSTLDVEIMKIANTLNAWNSEQICDLTRSKFTYDDNLNKHTFIVRDEKGKIQDELSIKEYITDFLGKEENENLIKSDVNTEGFNSEKAKKEQKRISSKGKYNPNDPSLIEDADHEGMEIDAYIKTLELQDAALKDRAEFNK